MSWFYYSGNTSIPIPVSKTKSVAVRPRTKVEILDESHPKVRRLIGTRELQRTSPPRSARQHDVSDAASKPGVEVTKDVLKKVVASRLGDSVAEKGTTGAANVAPKPPVSEKKTENTADETVLADSASDNTEGTKSDEKAASAVPVVTKKSKYKKK